MPVDKKRIGKKAGQMKDAWAEGAPNEEFKGHLLTDLTGKLSAIRVAEQETENLRAQVKLRETEINNMYGGLDDFIVDVGDGVRGHKDFGSDSALYGAMGFVRKSERKSGLIRGKKDNGEG